MNRYKKTVTEQDRDEVESMAGMGMTRVEIGIIKKMSVSTVKRKFKNELKNGRIKAKLSLRKNIYKMAMSGKFPVMAIFAGKTMAGLREKDRISLPKDSKPSIPITTKFGNDPIEAARIYQELMKG